MVARVSLIFQGVWRTLEALSLPFNTSLSSSPLISFVVRTPAPGITPGNSPVTHHLRVCRPSFELRVTGINCFPVPVLGLSPPFFLQPATSIPLLVSINNNSSPAFPSSPSPPLPTNNFPNCLTASRYVLRLLYLTAAAPPPRLRQLQRDIERRRLRGCSQQLTNSTRFLPLLHLPAQTTIQNITEVRTHASRFPRS